MALMAAMAGGLASMSSMEATLVGEEHGGGRALFGDDVGDGADVQLVHGAVGGELVAGVQALGADDGGHLLEDVRRGVHEGLPWWLFTRPRSVGVMRGREVLGGSGGFAVLVCAPGALVAAEVVALAVRDDVRVGPVGVEDAAAVRRSSRTCGSRRTAGRRGRRWRA
jgi:hypothetical protein